MTPQEFIDTLTPPETRRIVALVAAAPLYGIAQWLSALQALLKARHLYDSFEFRINPMRLHCRVDGISEPRLSITFHDPMAGQTPDNAPPVGAILIEELTL